MTYTMVCASLNYLAFSDTFQFVKSMRSKRSWIVRLRIVSTFSRRQTSGRNTRDKRGAPESRRSPHLALLRVSRGACISLVRLSLVESRDYRTRSSALGLMTRATCNSYYDILIRCSHAI